ncbi:MAG TPA: hypothetical protein VE987_15665 [Polyangiaceae bacterium]|nr:hypothetical protein [Polyangiaceae bacterium]
MSGRYHQAFLMKPSGNANDGISQPNPLVYLDGSQVVAAAMTTVPVFVANVDGYSIQFATIAGDTLVGTLTLQASNSRGSGQEQTENPDVTLYDWTTIELYDFSTGAFAANKAVASGAATYLIGVPSLYNCARWVRLVFAFTSGSGHPRVGFQQKGWA